MDHTSSFWITAFNEVAEKLLGVSANDLMKLKVGFLVGDLPAVELVTGCWLLTIQEGGDEQQFQSYFTKAAGRSYTFEMMAKQDSYNVSSNSPSTGGEMPDGDSQLTCQEQVRVRYTCRKAGIPDFVAESAYLSQQIALFNI
jgi:replication factor A1